MSVVVADASPIHYLILIGAADVLPHIFNKIHIPTEVRDELTRAAAPPQVRSWVQRAPAWLEVHSVSTATSDPALLVLDSGERAAIALAESLGADLLLIDERAGAKLAQQRGSAVTGTLGVLDLASRSGLLRLRDILPRLQKTNFRYPPSLIEKLIEDERKR